MHENVRSVANHCLRNACLTATVSSEEFQPRDQHGSDLPKQQYAFDITRDKLESVSCVNMVTSEITRENQLSNQESEMGDSGDKKVS
jgi:hypothetical protein